MTMTHTAGDSAQDRPAALFYIFFVFVLLPLGFTVGGLYLSPMRLLLLVSIIPVTAQVMSGSAGRTTSVDTLFLLHAIWVLVALVVSHGTSRLAFAGITAVEILGGYVMGRLLIRSRIQYETIFRLILLWLIVMFPLTMIELITGKQLINEPLSKFFDVPIRGGSAYGRMGMERVYSLFEHPIHFGLFCSMTLANLFFILTPSSGKAKMVFVFVFICSFASLSSGPLLSGALQLGLLSWHFIMGGRWKLLAVLFTIFYVSLDAASNRTPITIMLDTLTFNSGSAWTRIFIFEYGMRAVNSSPIFGVGFNDYPRPQWLTPSVDNFWLVELLRYGYVGGGCLIGGIVLHFRAIMRANIADPKVHQLRVGYLVALLALCLALVTVHIWGNIAVFVMFYIGAGAWFYTTDLSGGVTSAEPEAEETGRKRHRKRRSASRTSRYTRFPAEGQS